MQDNTISDSQLEDMVEFVDNPEPRCPCVLLLDVSGSMTGSRIQALNDGIQAFKQEVTADSLTALRAEIAVVAFNHEVNVVQDFVTADEFQPTTLEQIYQLRSITTLEHGGAKKKQKTFWYI